MKVGVLALQGDFEAHARKLAPRVGRVALVRNARDLDRLDLLVMPGGESTTMLKLMTPEFKETLSRRVREETLSIFATCAGVILIAKEVQNPAQASLGLLDICIERNAYGRQLDSFVGSLEWSAAVTGKPGPLEGVFIRAPRITRLGANVQPLLTYKGEPVMVRAANITAATFHPELSQTSDPIYDLILAPAKLLN